jgi:P27 family predicted phage terminase small subunit
MKKLAKPPKALSPEAKTWWRKLVRDYAIDDSAGHLLLENALQAFDEMRSAQAILEKEGQVFRDRYGQPRQHPATLVVRDARNLMLRSLRALNLDVLPGAPLGGN